LDAADFSKLEAWGNPSFKKMRSLPRHRSGWRKPANKAPPMRDIYARFDPRELRAELFQPTNWDRFVLGHAVSIVSIGPENHHDHPATYKVGRQSFSELPTTRAQNVKPRRGGRRGFESLAGFGGWERDPAKSDLQVSRWLIVPKISWRVRPAAPTIF
jgi:hypothetical protein